MKVTGMNAEKFETIVNNVNRKYAGNIVIQTITPITDNRFSVKMGTANSRAAGSRTSWSGRRGKYLCWHGFRDVIAAVFAENDSARVQTGMAVYRGKAGFEDVYPDTANVNIGSMMQPAYMPELCDC